MKKKKTTVRPKKNSCPSPRGALLIIGGKEDKGENKEEKQPPQDATELEILKTFIELTKKKDPAVAVITTASSLPDEVFSDYRKVFQKLGLSDIRQIHHKNRNEIFSEELLELAKTADAFFFSGGDQLLLTSIYGGSEFLTLIKDRYIHENIVIAGTSAGAMAMSTPMIYAGNKDVEQIAGGIKITTGLEFLKDVCIDTHFVHRGRFVRMAQVIVTNPTNIGIGVEEDTAMIIRNGIDAEIIGNGMIIIIDGFHIMNSNIADFGDKPVISMRNLRVHLLGKGEKYVIPQLNPPHK
jgi:cyanophycinase